MQKHSNIKQKIQMSPEQCKGKKEKQKENTIYIYTSKPVVNKTNTINQDLGTKKKNVFVNFLFTN